MTERAIRTKPEPFCPECGGRMVLRQPRGNQTWKPFWGCKDFPECDGTRQIKWDGTPEMDLGEDEWDIDW